MKYTVLGLAAAMVFATALTPAVAQQHRGHGGWHRGHGHHGHHHYRHHRGGNWAPWAVGAGALGLGAALAAPYAYNNNYYYQQPPAAYYNPYPYGYPYYGY